MAYTKDRLKVPAPADLYGPFSDHPFVGKSRPGKNAKIIYHTPAIISFSLYILSPLFEGQKHFLGAFFLKFWPYVRLVFKEVYNQEQVIMAHVQ